MPFVDLRSSLFVFVLGLAALSWGQEAHQHAPSTNPYELRLAAAEAAFTSASPAQASVLLNRIQNLSDYVDNPAEVTDFLHNVTADNRQSTLLRDEARSYLASPSRGENAQNSGPGNSHADELIHSAQQAVSADPSSAAAHETLGEVAQIHSRQGYSDEFEKAAQLAPTAARWVKVAESCSLAACRLSALQHALHSNPRDAKANALLASYYVDRHQLVKARALLQTAATSDPGDFVIAKQLADAYLATGRPSRAVAAYRRLETRFPAPLWLRRELGLKYADIGLFADAIRLLEPTFAGSTEDPAVYKALKRVYQRTQNSAKLRELERHDLSLHPANTESASSLSTVDSKSSRVDEAIRTMESLIAQHPNDSSLHEWLAYLYGSSGHKVQYEQELAKVTKLIGESDNLRPPGTRRCFHLEVRFRPPVSRKHLRNAARCESQSHLRLLERHFARERHGRTRITQRAELAAQPTRAVDEHRCGRLRLFHLSHSVQLRAPETGPDLGTYSQTRWPYRSR